jgi:hypothetical protein
MAFSKAAQTETIIIRTVKKTNNFHPIRSQGSAAGFRLDTTPESVGMVSYRSETLTQQ